MLLHRLLGISSERNYSDEQFLAIVKQEGFQDKILQEDPISNPDISEAARILFSFIPPVPNDPRWLLAQKFSQLRDMEGRKPGFALHNGLMSIYLSKNISYRDGFASTLSEPNIRQHCRAMWNMEFARKLEMSNRQQRLQISNEFYLRYARTESVQRGKDEKGVTGCPESLSQVQAFYEGNYIGRVGFNAHIEGSSTIISIVNMQGVPGVDYREFQDQAQIPIFNTLVKAVSTLSETLDGTNYIELRGLKNPKNGDSRLYNSVLKREKIDRYHYKHKQRVTS